MKKILQVGLVAVLAFLMLASGVNGEEKDDTYIHITNETGLYVNEEGELFVWGNIKQLTIQDQTGILYTPLKVMDGVSKAESTRAGIFVLTKDGDLLYGSKYQSLPEDLDRGDGFIIINQHVLDFDTDGSQLCVISSDQRLWVTKNNDIEWTISSGSGGFTFKHLLNDVMAVSVSENDKTFDSSLADSYIYVIKTDHSLWSTKNDFSNKIADNIIKIRGGDNFVYMIDKDHVLYGWGDGGNYTLPYKSDFTVKPVVLDEDVLDVFPSEGFNGDYSSHLVLKTDGIIYDFYMGTMTPVLEGVKDFYYDTNLIYRASDNKVHTLGANLNGTLGIGNTYHYKEPVLIGQGMKDVSIGDTYGIALTREGIPLLWGDFGYGHRLDSPAPIYGDLIKNAVSLESVRTGHYYRDYYSKIVGEDYTYYFKMTSSTLSEEDSRIFNADDYFDGALTRTSIKRSKPDKYDFRLQDGLDVYVITKDGKLETNDPLVFSDYSKHVNHGVKDFNVYGISYFLLNTSGQVYQWYENTNDYAEDESLLTPKLIAEDVVSLDVIAFNTFILKGSGDYLICHETNPFSSDRYEDFNLVTSHVKAIDGYLALKEDGGLYDYENVVKGHNFNDMSANLQIPDRILEDVIKFSRGKYVSAAITSNGNLYTWGENSSSVIGNGLPCYTLQPQSPVFPLEDYKGIEAYLLDVKPSHPYYEAMNFFYMKKLVTGYPDMTMKADNDITRAEVAAIISKTFGLEMTSKKRSFTDIDDHWAKDYVMIMGSNDVFSGYEDGSFGVNKNILKCELFTVLSNMTGGLSEDIDKDKFAQKAWYYPYLYDMKAKGILNQEELDLMIETATHNSSRGLVMEVLFRAYLAGLIIT